MSKIFALDLGSNSIGYAVRDTDRHDKVSEQFEDFGAIVFPKGVGMGKTSEYSLASQRTKFRSTRRLYQVRKYRIWATLKVLIEYGLTPLTIEELEKWSKYDKESKRKYPIDSPVFEAWVRLDFNMDGKPDFANPYELRNELATIELDFDKQVNRYKLGRALYHIAQRRGFRSSKKGGSDDESKENDSEKIISEDCDVLKESEVKKSAKISQYIEDNNIKPALVCCALAELTKVGDRVRESYQIVRSQYKDEVKHIFKLQSSLANIKEIEKKIDKAIFYQRPLRSQKWNVGKCTLETNKFRSPQSHYDFEEFRARTFINNIKCDGEYLSEEHRNGLYNDLFLGRLHSSFNFALIREWLEKKLFRILNYSDKSINYKDNTKIAASPVSARLCSVFGDNWRNYSIDKYSIEDIWHILYTVEDREWLQEFFDKKLKLEEKKIKSLLVLGGRMDSGYSMLSRKAIQNINRFLRKGLIYSDAVLLAKLPDIFGDRWSVDTEIDICNRIGILTSEVNHKRKVYNIVNSLISKYNSTPDNRTYAMYDQSYRLDDADIRDINEYIIDAYGERSWSQKSENSQKQIINEVTELFQSFFASKKRTYQKMPKLGDSIIQIIISEYDIEEMSARKIYHPSQTEFYKAAEGLLGSPVIGAFKNPVATRALHQLRRLTNHLIEKNIIDENTRVIVELARDVDDKNRRKAIDLYQKEREAENQEIEKMIRDYYNDKDKSMVISHSDTERAKLFVEQWDITEDGRDLVGNEKNIDKRSKRKKAELHRIENELKDKIKLWKDQEYCCIYTGKPISISNLLNDNVVDIEHTIPRSKSLDNSLANKTICFLDFNRNIKKGSIPTSLSNYEQIKKRLTPWIERVEKLKDNVAFWRNKSKYAQDKDSKDRAIVQKHLWQMRLDYWQGKVDRFLISDVTSGFRNNQLNDTRIISKYAMHYLKSYFHSVEVQKGEVTSSFRQIMGLQNIDEKKSRELHTHHAVDAATLALIPKVAERDKILKIYYQIKESKIMQKPYDDLIRSLDIAKATNKINNADGVIELINKNTLINHTVIDRTLKPAVKSSKGKGRFKGKTMKYTGDSIRGKLHQDTFYGAIKPAIEENGIPSRDIFGEFIQQETVKYVVRRVLAYKKNDNDSGFKTVEEILSSIVNKELGRMIKQQVDDLHSGSLSDAISAGLYIYKNGKQIKVDKRGRKLNPIRHIRCYASVANPLAIKLQTYKSSHEYKNNYYVGVGDLYAVCRYVNDKGQFKYESINLFKITENKKTIGCEYSDKLIASNKIYRIDRVFTRGMKVLIGTRDELYDMDTKLLSERLYIIGGFESPSKVIMRRHLTAKPEKDLGKGSSIKLDEPLPLKIRCGLNTVNGLFEGYDFEVTPNGKIEFNQ